MLGLPAQMPAAASSMTSHFILGWWLADGRLIELRDALLGDLAFFYALAMTKRNWPDSVTRLLQGSGVIYSATKAGSSIHAYMVSAWV